MDARKTILIIEDDPVVTAVYQRQFAMRGLLVEIAADGDAALRKLRRSVPDLVLLDLQLPKVSGIEVLKFIRANTSTRAIPVIVFTNAYLGSVVDKAWEAGADRCLTKAFTPARKLIEIVMATLAKAGQPPVPHAPSTPGKPSEDTLFQTSVRQKFLDQTPAFLVDLRAHLTKFIKGDGEGGVAATEDRLGILGAMAQTLHVLTGNAGLAGFERIADLSSAIEALIDELQSDPQSINPSTLRTIATAVDLFDGLFESARRDEPMASLHPKILVVDDEATSRRLILAGLDKAGLQAEAIEDPAVALEKAAKVRYDLVFLDIDMPGMDGFELCSRLRATAGYAKTPVVFVTVLNDFNTRARSIMSGANDFIAKPFLLIELAVKALVYVHRGQAPAERAAAAPNPPA